MSVKIDELSDEKFSYIHNELSDEKFSCIHNGDSSSTSPKHEIISDMLMWLRRAALDPCNPKRSAEKVKQILKMRKVLFLSSTEMPWKKRTFCMLQERSRVTTAVSLKKPKEQNSFASSVSCLINCADSTESSEHVIQNPPNSARLKISRANRSRKVVLNSHPFECDDSISGSYPMRLPKPEVQTLRRSVELLKSSNNLPIKQVWTSLAGPPRKNFSPAIDSDDSVDSSNESSPTDPKKLKTCRRSPRLLNFIGDYLPKLVIPVGPRFQANIPDWTGPLNRQHSSGDAKCNSDNSRLLGTKIWPIEDKSLEISSKGVGRGRPYSCSCDSSGSVKCIKRHILEKRRQLQDDLGPTFFIWRFDEMGEDVSKSWTLKEQKNFNIIVSKSKSFLKPALKQFSSRSRENIISYYFNVYSLRLVTKQARLGSKIINSDEDDEAVDVVSSSTLEKTQYLIRGR